MLLPTLNWPTEKSKKDNKKFSSNVTPNSDKKSPDNLDSLKENLIYDLNFFYFYIIINNNKNTLK